MPVSGFWDPAGSSNTGFQPLAPKFSFIVAVWPREQQNERGNDSLDPKLEV